MLVKENPDEKYSLFYDQIEGFDYQEGFEYELVVQEEEVENPPADPCLWSGVATRPLGGRG